MNEADQYIMDVITLHQVGHRRLREEIAGLDSAALNWSLGPETSSIGTIVMHALGADAEVLRNILLIPTQRSRDAEFAAQDHQPDAIKKLLDSVEADWEQLALNLQENHLQTLIPRPNKPTPESGLFWLMRNYGHICEHLGQVQLTKQLYQMSHLEF